MRIVSLAPSATEILFELGLGDKLVGRTRFCNYPEEVKDIPNVGGWLDIDYKKIDHIKPDLILTSTFVQDKIVEELKSKGYKILHFDPITLDDVMESILSMGKVFGVYDKAVLIVDKMKAKIISIKSKLIKISHIPNIYIEEWHMPPTASGNWVPDMLKLIKAKSVIPEGRRSTPVTTKQLQEFDPEKIIISWCGFGKDIKPEFIEQLKKRDGYEKLDAVALNKIFVLDDSYLNRPGPRLVEGLEKLARIIHPQAFVDNSIDDLFKKISGHNEGTVWLGENEFED